MTTIEWCQNDDGTRGKTWNPIRGCSRVSPGCDECYAMKFAHRFSGAGKPYEGLTTIRHGKVDWSGVARFIPSELDAPLRWRKPQRVFVNSMSDLFHHSITNEQIAAVFGVMAAAPQHTFQILTKRPERAVEWFGWVTEQDDDPPWTLMLGNAANFLAGERWDRVLAATGLDQDDQIGEPWPLPNVHLGVSVEDEQRANERIPLLLQCPAAVRWISAEPLLGPLDCLSYWLHKPCGWSGCGTCNHRPGLPGLDWVVIGGESGPGARPYDLAWPRSIIEQCRAAGVPVFHKQVGKAHVSHCGQCGRTIGMTRGGLVDECGPTHAAVRAQHVQIRDSKGGDPSEWPADLRVREFPEQAEREEIADRERAARLRAEFRRLVREIQGAEGG